MGSFSSYTTKNNTIFNAKTSYTIDMFMNMFVCLSTSQTNEHWPLIGRTNEHDLTNTVRLFIGHPGNKEIRSFMAVDISLFAIWTWSRPMIDDSPDRSDIRMLLCSSIRRSAANICSAKRGCTVRPTTFEFAKSEPGRCCNLQKSVWHFFRGPDLLCFTYMVAKSPSRAETAHYPQYEL